MTLPTITIVGALGADPELRFTSNGLAVVSLSIAVSDRRLNRQTNEWEEGETQWYRATCWREFAEHVAGSLVKGSRVIATGRLKQRNYQDREGNSRTSIELEVDEIGPSLRYATAQVTRASSSRENTPAVSDGAQWPAREPGDGSWAVGGGDPSGDTPF